MGRAALLGRSPLTPASGMLAALAGAAAGEPDGLGNGELPLVRS